VDTLSGLELKSAVIMHRILSALCLVKLRIHIEADLATVHYGSQNTVNRLQTIPRAATRQLQLWIPFSSCTARCYVWKAPGVSFVETLAL
jgi:hypothetical protein